MVTLSVLMLVALAAQEPPTETATEPSTLTGIVLLPDGSPAAEAAIELHRYLLQDTNSVDLVHARVPQQTRLLTCAADGSFHVELPPGVPFQLRARAGKSAVEVMRRVHAGETLTVRLRRGAMLEGIVTRRTDGKPMPAALRVWEPVTGVEIRHGETDAAGHYSFARLPPDTLMLEIRPAAGKEPAWPTLLLSAGRTLRHDIQIDELEFVAAGRVLDSVTRRPIAGAEVSDTWIFGRVARTDADGRFRLHGVQRNELHARAPDHGKICLAPNGDLQNLEIVLQPGSKARGKIVDASGRPLTDAYVAVTAHERIDQREQTDWLSVFTGADGSFVIGAVRRDLPHCLLVRRDGHAALAYDFPADEANRNDIDFGIITLPPAIYLTGRVTDEQGQPIAGTPVTLGGTQDDRYRFCDGKRDEKPRGGFYVNGRNTVTDSLGRYHFADLGVGRYRVRARVEQVTPRLVGSSVIETEVITVETQPTQSVVRRDFTLELGRNLQARVMTGSGEPPPAVAVRYGPADGPLSTAMLIVKTGIPFRLFRLPAGAIVLEATPCNFNGEPVHPDAPVAMRALDRVTAQPLWLCLPEPRWVQAFVVDARGEPVVGGKVTATTAAGTDLGEHLTDARGSVAVFLGEQTAVRLQVRPEPGSGSAETRSDLLSGGTANVVLVRR